MPEEVDRLLLQVETDLRSINESNRALDSVAKRQKAIGDEAKKSSQVAESAHKRWIQSLKEVNKALLDNAANQAKAQNAARDLDLGGATADVRGLLRGVGASGAADALDLASDSLASIQNLDKLKESIAGIPNAAGSAISALGVGGVGLIGGLGAAAAGALILADAYTKGKEAADLRIKAENDFIEITRTATTEQIKEKLKVLALDREIAEAQFKNAADKIAPGIQQVLDMGSDFGIAAGALYRSVASSLDPAIVSASEALTAASEELKVNATLTDIYTRALTSNSVAANDAAIALDSMRKGNDDFFKRVTDIDIQGQVAALTASSDSIRQNIAALTIEKEARERALAEGLLGSEAAIEYGREIANLNERLIALQKNLPVAAFRESIAAAEEYSKKLVQIETDLGDQRTTAAAARDEALTEAATSAAEGRNEAARKADLDREAEQERHEKALAKIQRSYNQDRTDAIQNRDVLALQAAKEARKEALRSENDANKDRKSAIDKALREQNRSIEKALNTQTAAIQKRYTEQINAAQTAAAAAKAIEEKKNADILAVTQSGADSLLAKHKALWDAVNALPVQPAAALPNVPAATQSARRLLDNVPLTPISLPAIPQQGFSGRGGGGSSSGANITIPINVNGMNRRMVETTSGDAARRHLDYILKEMGL